MERVLRDAVWEVTAMAASNPRDDNRTVRDSSLVIRDPLECALMEAFLADRGHTFQSIKKLPEARRGELLRDAAQHASLRLAEIESRAHLVNDLEP
jgi:hypothetical protein